MCLWTPEIVKHHVSNILHIAAFIDRHLNFVQTVGDNASILYFYFLEMTYVPQENIEVIKNTKILHPSVEDYFENFDGSQYLPRPWLKTVYPRD